MNNKTYIKSLASAAVTAALLVACGGGGSTTTTSSTSKTTEGRISGFGSVIVNGVHYDVSGGSITADGRPINEADLKVGMIVRIKGEVRADGTGSATSLTFDDDLEGPVSSVDLANNSFLVLGQTVLVDAETVFEGTSLDTLVAGSVVEVSGYLDDNGTLRASLVELSDSTEFEVKGRIANLNDADRTFTLGALTVDYAVATLEDITALAEGLFVEVKSSQPLQNGVLVAETIEGEHEGIEAAEGEDVDIEGVVTAFVSAADFAVNGQPVRADANTAFENGGADKLAVNVRLEVEGSMDASGILVAEKISFKHESQIRTEAAIDAVDERAGTLTVLGLVFKVDRLTAFRDETAAADQYLNLGKLMPGQWVELRAYQSADGSLVASYIERDDAEEAASLRGPAADIAEPNFSILGITVTTDSGTTSFEPSSFFSVVAPGALVEAGGALTGDGVFAATEVELED